MKRRDDIESKIHPRYLPVIAAARAQGRTAIALTGLTPGAAYEVKTGIRIRQGETPPNKLEEACGEVLKWSFKIEPMFGKIRLRISNGHWYKPDWFVPSQLLFVEVKGPHAHRGGFENLKDAASLHTWAKFRLMWRVRGEWLMQDILP